MPHAAEIIDARAGHAHGGPTALTLYYGMFAPPLAWCLQEYVDFGLASHACFPARVPRATFLPGFEGVWSALLSINLVLLILSACGLLTSYLAWARLKRSGPRHSDEHHYLLEPGEGRVRVFAASGILVALLFTIAIAFNTISLATLFTCSQV